MTSVSNKTTEYNSSVVKVSNITKIFKNYNGTFKALDNVSFDIKKGEFVVISGENGSGKSLLMSIIAHLEKPTIGTVYTSFPVGLILQDADASILGDTPEDDILFGLVNIGKKKNEAKEIAKTMLEKVGLYDKKDSSAYKLSGGEKRRLAIASILALGFETIILDEPYSNLDYKGVREVNNVILSLLGEGHTIILLTHEIEKCLGKADSLIVLKEGKVEFNGPPQNAIESGIEKWGIKNPLVTYNTIEDLFW